MLYRRTPELPPLRYINNGVLSSGIFPPQNIGSESPSSELYLRSLWLETSLTKNSTLTLPASGPDQNGARTIFSRKYNAYMTFKTKQNEIVAKFAKITTLTSLSISSNYITANNVTASATTTQDISVGHTGNISVLHSNEISTDRLTASDGKVDNISGDRLHYEHGEISTLRTTTIETRDITATGIAKLTAAATYWADLAELYESNEIFEPGTLVKFNGRNEIEIASDGTANGVISKNPGILLNSSLKNKSISNPIILVGRSIVKIKDKIDKFDRIELSDIPGIAQKASTKKRILGISLESKLETEIKPVECVVKLTI